MAKATLTRDHGEILQLTGAYGLVPVEMLPHIVDGVPSTLRLLTSEVAKKHKDYRMISWEDFFAKFDAMGLILAYEGKTGRAELFLQK